MKSRKVIYTEGFSKSLKLLIRKHPDLQDTVRVYLDECSTSGTPRTSHRIPKLGEYSAFKDRLPLRGVGKRGGARIIYFCDADCVVALFLYTKSSRENIPLKEIKRALATEINETLPYNPQE